MTMETTLDKQKQFINAGGSAAMRPGFVPPSPWEELEAARVAHESALVEHAGRGARRQKARAEEARLKETLDVIHKERREIEAEATAAVKQSAIVALGVVAEHGEAWLAKIATERAAALEEADEHRAALEAAEARAHKHDAVEAWIKQAMTASVPQPFDADAAPVPS